MECPNCGQENRDVARFCQRCGASLAIMEPVADPTAAAATSEVRPAEAMEPAEAMPLDDESASLPEQAEQPLDSDADLDTPALVPAVDEPDSELQPAPARPEDEFEAAQAVEQVTDGALATEPAPSTATEQDETEPLSPACEPSQPPVPELEAFETADATDPDEDEGQESVPELKEADPGQEPGPSIADLLTGDQAIGHHPLVKEQELAAAHLLPRNEPALLEPLELGTVLNGRYQIIEVLDTQPTQIQYRVRDLQRCPRCGTDGHSPDEAFCATCGALMDQKPVALILQQPAAVGHPPEAIEPEDLFAEGEQNYWVWREHVPEEIVQSEQPLMRLLVGLQSDTGQVRELDEDSMFVLTMAFTYESITHQLGLFIVADGMGGHEGGEVASRLAIQIAAQSLMRDLFSPELAGNALSTTEILDRIGNALRQANDEVYLERQKRENDMGTTLTAAFVKDWSLHLGHVGDCRAYRWGESGLQQLTTDHSIVAGMVAAGTILPEEIYTHPQRSVIYRCIGDQPTVEVDVGSVQLEPGERILVCCDGLWEMLRSEGIEDILLAEADPQTACDEMVHQANLAGGNDNISVIIVQL